MSRWVDATLFLCLSVVWGLSFPAIAVGLEYVPPLFFAALRYDVAALLLLAYAAVRLDGWYPSGRNNLVAITGGGLFFVAGNGLLFVAQQTVPSSVAAIIQALLPIVTAIWALVLLGERPTRTGLAGVVLGFAGISFVIQPDPASLLAGDTLGRLLVVVQVISVGLGGVIIQRAEPDIGRVALTGWSMLLGAVVLHAGSLLAREVPTAEVTVPTAVGAIVYLGVFSTAVAFFIYFTILEEHGAFEAALVSYLVPVVATLVGVFVLGETLGLPSVVGFGLIAVGFALLKRRAISAAIDDVVIGGG
jgi:drug/metabolite transporter (DMT)-like permease